MKMRATERMAWAFVDPRGMIASAGWAPDGRTIFRTEAINRGYCLDLWDSHVRAGFGHAGYGIIGTLGRWVNP